MDFTISNAVASRFIAVVAMLAMVAGVVAPMAANAQAAVVDPAPTCAVIVTSNENGDNPTNGGVETYVHPNWTEDIIGGQWLWSTATVTDTTVNQTATFTHDFIWGGDTITNIDFQFAADNGYVVELNGTEIGSESSATNNHESVTQLTVDPADVIVGENTLSFEITNLGTPAETNPENNPAGFVFKMIIDGTGTNCDEVPVVDVCDNLRGDQPTVPEGYVKEGFSCYPAVVTEGADRPLECIGDSNMLDNGSFEAEIADASAAAGGFYEVFATITGWASVGGIELWNNMFGGASDGNQNAELDVAAATKLTQSVDTVVGNLYQVTLDFAPRVDTSADDNKIELFANANSIGYMEADGSINPVNLWTTLTYNFLADSTSTEIALQDVGVSNGVGSLVDNVKVCLIDDNTPVEEEEYKISGYKFNDENADGVWDTESEDGLRGWEIVLTEGDSVPVTTTTDENGLYSFIVNAGSYQVSETAQEGWEQTATLGTNVDGDSCFINILDEEISFSKEAEPMYTCTFGNHEAEERRGGGSSSGTRVGDRTRSTPTGEVLGSSTSTPTGVVLGEATTTMPVGAPNTGAGSTSPVSVSLPTMVAILGTSTRKSK